MAEMPSSTPDLSDPLSPTTKVLSYLRSKGLKPSSENVYRALDENAKDRTTIPGLVNQEPSRPDMPSKLNMGGGEGTPSSAPARGATPTPKTPPTGGTPDQNAGPRTTSAAPTSENEDNALDPLGALIAAGAGLGTYGLSRFAGGGGAVPMNAVPGGAPATTIPQLGGSGGPTSMLGFNGPDPMLQLQGPTQPNLLENAMRRALMNSSDGAIPLLDQSVIPMPGPTAAPEPMPNVPFRPTTAPRIAPTGPLQQGGGGANIQRMLEGFSQLLRGARI